MILFGGGESSFPSRLLESPSLCILQVVVALIELLLLSFLCSYPYKCFDNELGTWGTDYALGIFMVGDNHPPPSTLAQRRY